MDCQIERELGSSLFLTYVVQLFGVNFMNRLLRIEYLNAWHYVINRGRRSEKIHDGHFARSLSFFSFFQQRKQTTDDLGNAAVRIIFHPKVLA